MAVPRGDPVQIRKESVKTLNHGECGGNALGLDDGDDGGEDTSCVGVIIYSSYSIHVFLTKRRLLSPIVRISAWRVPNLPCLCEFVLLIYRSFFANRLSGFGRVR
jgi:hypothetical protein